MTICKFCQKEMNKVDTCSLEIFNIKGTEYKRDTEHHDGNERCHDCNIINGNFHHPGCDMERCPKCGGQAIGCSCDDEEEKD